MTDDRDTQPIPPETLAECAAAWRKQFAEQGLVEERNAE